MCFHRFHERWLNHLRHLLHQLSLAPKPTTPDHNHDLIHLVDAVMAHYAEYYRAKAAAADRDVLSVLGASWSTALERSLQWIGGWRPTIVFHLVYSESSILFESHIGDILRGRRTGDLGDLSSRQFTRVSDLQCETVREENDITAELSDWQDSASDLASMSTDFDAKIRRLERILGKADDLRLRTIRGVVELLTPQQAVEFLIAAAELQFGVHEWGLNQEHRRGNI